MEKEEIVIESVPVRKRFNWRILFIIIIVLLFLAIIAVFSISIYEKINAPENDTGTSNITNISLSQNDTPITPTINNTPANLTNTTRNITNPPDDPLNPPDSCSPNCAGKNCGSDGCSGSCGSCNSTQYCNSAGRCVQIPIPPENCTPNCAGKNCGSDGCSGSCGSCNSTQYCNSAGRCAAILEGCNADGDCTAFTGACGIGKCNQTTKKCYSSFNASTTLCRNNISECDAVEMCSGNSINCPNNANKSDGAVCSLGACLTGRCTRTDIKLTNNISQYGITWYFDKQYEYGTFANGDYWVLGPVIITKIEPDFNGNNHGWMVNPSDFTFHAYDSRIGAFNASLVPSLPYTAKAGESVIKAISVDTSLASCRPCLETAAVLTVLGSVPPNSGKSSFRPPYFGNKKPSYSTDSLNLNLLPSYKFSNPPAIEGFGGGIKRVQLDHKIDWMGDYMHPKSNLPNYGANIANRNNEIALRLMLNDSIEDKRNLTIYYVQEGIDLYELSRLGASWTAGGGIFEGRKLPIALAGILLENDTIKNWIANSGRYQFGENSQTNFSKNAGVALYFQDRMLSWSYIEGRYWLDMTGKDISAKTESDPYGYIDGGMVPGASYMDCCINNPLKGSALAVRLMPQLDSIWNHRHMLEFADRYKYHGIWTQPDPCAPPTGICAGGTNPGTSCTFANISVCLGGGTCDYVARWDQDYKVKYGPDPAKPGDCIRDTDSSDGIGRAPLLHGTNKDFCGHCMGAWVNDLWASHRGEACFNGYCNATAGENAENCAYDCGSMPSLFPVEKKSWIEEFLRLIKNIF